MHEYIKNFIAAFRQMNRLSKAYIRWGSPLVFTSAVLALFCRLSAGFIGVFDNMLFLSGELFELFKNMIAAVYVPAFVIELVVLMAKRDGFN